MSKFKKPMVLTSCLLLLTLADTATAGDVEIVAADFHKTGSNTWSANVTLKHDDSGWDHYADNWRVVDSEGNVLGNRVLHHPHVNEQPFTRGLGSIKIPQDISTVFVEAHDKVHSWSADRFKVDLGKADHGK